MSPLLHYHQHLYSSLLLCLYVSSLQHLKHQLHQSSLLHLQEILKYLHQLRGVSKKFVDKCNNVFIYGRIAIKIVWMILQHSTIKLPVNNCFVWYTSRIPRRHRNQNSLPRRYSNSLKPLLHSTPNYPRNSSFITT